MARAKRRNRYSDDETEIENGLENGNEMEGVEEGVEEMQHAAREGAHTASDMGRRAFQRMQQSPLNPFDLFGGPVARMMDQNWSIFQKMMHAMREESFHFFNRRLEETGHAIESSRDCDGISDLLAVQQEWMVSFARDYAEQTKRFAEIMRDVAEDGTANLSHTASEVTERGKNAVEEEAHRAAA